MIREPSVFEKATKVTEKKGRHTIKCRKGLWAVDAPSKAAAIKEALHYFFQYYNDGEYKDYE